MGFDLHSLKWLLDMLCMSAQRARRKAVWLQLYGSAGHGGALYRYCCQPCEL